MTILQALGHDPRFHQLGGRKQVALEIIVRCMDQILNGDDPYPAAWQRIEDCVRQEQGISPKHLWEPEA